MKNYRSFNSTRILFSTLTLATTLGPLACSLAIEDEQTPKGNVTEDAADLSAASKKAKPAIAEFRGATGDPGSAVSVGVTTVGVGSSGVTSGSATSGSATSGSATSGGGTGGYDGSGSTSGSTGSGKDSTSTTTSTTNGTATSTTTTGGGGTGGYGGAGGAGGSTNGSTVSSSSVFTTTTTTTTSGGGSTSISTVSSTSGYTSGSTGTTGDIPGGKDPDALVLTITKDAPVCNGDNSVAPCDDWRVTISIPVALQHPGTIPLSSSDLNSSFFVTLPENGSGLCGGGGGSFVKGSIEILSIDAGKVVFKMKNTEQFGLNLDGKYVAEVCAPPPPPPPPPPAGPTSVIALLQSEVVLEPPTGGSGVSVSASASASAGGGPTVDPDSLVLILSDHPRVCTHPFAPVGCPGWNVSIRIPPALQQPGIIPLSSLSSIGSANIPSEGSTTCGFGGGTFFDGTIEIVSIDASQVTFRLEDTQKWAFNADGEYTAPRCFTP